MRSKYKVVTVHNYYQRWGGEDQVFESESALLESKGHDVIRFDVHNDSIAWRPRLSVAAGTVWRRSISRELRALFRRVRPDLVHFHNTFPQISPSAYYAAAAEGLPVVQTLPNFRLLCAKATLFRNGSVCEDCMRRRIPLPAVRHACYRGSVAASAAAGAMQAVHRALRTWNRKVDCYVATSDFVRDKFVEAGFDPEQVVVKPNLTVDPGGTPREQTRRGTLYVGRLSEEKGLHTLMTAWRDIPAPLDVLGEGPLDATLKREAPDRVKFRGVKPKQYVVHALRNAQFLVVPSEWFEAFGLVIIEAFAVGTPVIVSGIAAPAEIVEDGITGLHFAPGDVGDLRAKVLWALAHPDEMRRMGENARIAYEERYSPDENYRQLALIYANVVGRTKGVGVRGAVSPSRNSVGRLSH